MVDFERMSVAALRKFAKEQNPPIFLNSEAKRDQILKVIMNPRNYNRIETTKLKSIALRRGIKVLGREATILALLNSNKVPPPVKKSTPPPVKKSVQSKYKIIKTLANGDCFYESVLIGIEGDRLTNRSKIGALRWKVVEYVDNDLSNQSNNNNVDTDIQGNPITKTQLLNYIGGNGWAGLREIVAVSKILKVNIIVLGRDMKRVETLTPPKNSSFTKTVYVLYDAHGGKMGTHFDALVPSQPQVKKKIYSPIKTRTSPIRERFILRNINLNRTVSDLIANVPFKIPAPVPVNKVSKAVVNVEQSPSGVGTMMAKDYQLAVRNALLRDDQKGLVAVHSIGSGKTYTSIITAKALIDAKKVKRIVLIAPATLVNNFTKELTATGHSDLAKMCMTYTYNSAYNDLTGRTNPNKMVEYVRAGQKIRSKYVPLSKELIKDSFVIIDEIHNLNDPVDKPKKDGKLTITKVIRDACHMAPKVLGLTATPVVNTLADIRSIISIVSGISIKDILLKGNYAETYGRFFSFYERDVNDTNFPDYTLYRTRIPMDEGYFIKYRDIEKQISKRSDYDSMAFKLALRASANKIEDEPNNTKIKWIVDKLKEGQKTIVFSEFRAIGIEIIQEQMNKLGIKYVEVTGDNDASDRSEAVRKYNKGDVRVIFLTKAGGEGIDLKMTDNVIIMEPPWNPARLFQAIGRAVRLRSHKDARGRGHVNAYCLSLCYSKEQTEQAKREIKGDASSIDDYMYTHFVSAKMNLITQFYREFYPHSIGRQANVKYPSFIMKRFTANNR